MRLQARGFERPDPIRAQARASALERVREWTRARFRLTEDDAVMVTEVACGLPGCPPMETFIAFWTAPDRRHQFKVFKPLEAVSESDLPPHWMRDSLLFVDDDGCECC